MDDIITQVDLVANNLQRDLVDSLELYEKNYLTNNKNILKKSSELSNAMNMERDNIINLKDEYISNTCTYVTLKKKKELKQVKKGRDRTMSSEIAATSQADTSNDSADRVSEK